MTTAPTASLAALLREAAAVLAAAGIADAAVDADLLAAHVLGTSRGGVQAAALRGQAVAPDAAARLRAVVDRRAQREPLQHITGRAPFRHLELAVGPGVFIPRPETEILVQIAVDTLAALPVPEPRAVDLGTGSGAIALAMATEVPRSRVWAVERSPQAAAWARRNIDEAAAHNVRLMEADFADALHELDGTVDVVASNPPYVPAAAVPAAPEVGLFDPAEALYSGPDGLDDIRVLSRVGLRLARPGGLVVLEHAEHQGAAVRGILTADGWRASATFPDLTRRDRVTCGIHP